MGQKPLQWENHPEHPEMRGKGLSAHMDVSVCAHVCVCVYVCVCLQGPAGDLLSMRPHDLFTVPLSDLTLHKHTHGQTHDFQYFSDKEESANVAFFLSGQAGENGVWCAQNRCVTLSLTAVASYFPLHFSALSVLFSFQLFLQS